MPFFVVVLTGRVQYYRSPASVPDDDSQALKAAIVSPPPFNSRRWKHKKYWHTIAGYKRHQLSPGQAWTPQAFEAGMRRSSIGEYLALMLDNVDKVPFK
jgi:hypothetical protein